MTVSTPPRPPSPARTAQEAKPLDREEIEALVEALIEEARRETRRRHRRYWASAALVALVGVVVLILLDGGAASQTVSPAVSGRMNAAVQPGTSRIAFVSEPRGGGYCGTVYVMNPDGSEQRRLTNGGVPDCGQEWGHAWSPNGREIAFVSGLDPPTITVMTADGSGQRTLTPSGAWWPHSPAWSPDGRMIAFVGTGGGIYVANADGSGQPRLLVRDVRGDSNLSWSPDGRRIAFVARRNRNYDIYSVGSDGRRLRKLTNNVGRDSAPGWSPDGRRIVFESNWQVWVMNADGSAKRRLTRNGGRNFAPAWSPDGKKVAFERRLGRQQSAPCIGCGNALHFEVWVMSADGSQARLLAERAAQPSWSPDGRKMAFMRQLGARHQIGGVPSDIYVMNADGSGQRNLTRAGGNRESQPIWSPAQK